MAAILPSDIEYRQFSDEQFVGFASAAVLEYQNPDLSWQDDLNDAARDFLFDYAAMD